MLQDRNPTTLMDVNQIIQLMSELLQTNQVGKKCNRPQQKAHKNPPRILKIQILQMQNLLLLDLVQLKMGV